MRSAHLRSLPLLPASLLVLAAGLSPSPAMAAGPADAVISLTPAQVQSLGVQTVAARQVPQASSTWPATLSLPPQAQRVVAAPVTGVVETLQVAPGQHVKAGQALGQLRSPQTQELQRDVQQSGAQLELARRQLERDRQLHGEGLIPQARLEATTAQWQLARALHAERSASRTLLGGTPDAQGLLTFRAPMTGVVVEQLAQPGQRVEASTPLWRLARLDTLWVEATLPASEAARLRLGDTVELMVEGDAAAPQARLAQIHPLVDPVTQGVAVRATLDNAQARLRPGQIAQLRLQTRAGEGQRIWRIPQTAIAATVGQKAPVFIEQGPGRFVTREVKVLGRDGGDFTVSGLSGPEAVVFRGLAALKALRQP